MPSYTTGDIRPPWVGLYSAIADVLIDLSGRIITRTATSVAIGDTTLNVESTDRFPSAGKLIVGGEVVNYTGKTTTTFTGITDSAGNAGCPVAVRVHRLVYDHTRTSTQLDNLRARCLLGLAQDIELDIFARNHGLRRSIGLDDDTFRAILGEITYGYAQTVYLCEQVLDILLPGGYDLYEDLESYPHTVFVAWDTLKGDSYKGKTFLEGGEEQNRVTLTTVDVDNPVVLVWGVWDVGDPDRRGTNYAEAVVSATFSGATATSAGAWVAGDDGKAIIVDDIDYWQATYVSTNQLTLSSYEFDDGSTDDDEDDILTTDNGRFAEWMVGHNVEITSGDNAGVYTIDEYIDRFSVRFTTGGLVTDIAVSWKLVPNYPASGPFDCRVNRATFASNTITTPVNMPATVLVDYSTIAGSAQLLERFTVVGNDQYPFYLWDEAAIIQEILDLITAAGVQVVLTPE